MTTKKELTERLRELSQVCSECEHPRCIAKVESVANWLNDPEVSGQNKVQDMADRLITTLASSMESEQADAIVRDVATELYRDVLGIDGKIVVDESKPAGFVHGGFGKNGRKAAMTIASYKFQPKE